MPWSGRRSSAGIGPLERCGNLHDKGPARHRGGGCRAGHATNPTGGMVRNRGACRSDRHHVELSKDPNTLISQSQVTTWVNPLPPPARTAPRRAPTRTPPWPGRVQRLAPGWPVGCGGHLDERQRRTRNLTGHASGEQLTPCTLAAPPLACPVRTPVRASPPDEETPAPKTGRPCGWSARATPWPIPAGQRRM